MKELTEYKDLDVSTFDNTRLPLRNCKFWNKDGVEFFGTLRAIRGGVWPFMRCGGGEFSFCAQIITRYPRYVPEGVAPLPEDSPFLAYLTQHDLEKTKEFYFEKNELYVWDTYKWITCNSYNPYYDHYAIDVSTDWARENYPEIVKAMEYEPIGKDPSIIGGPWKVGHKLGDKTYDLNWNRTDLLPEDVFGKEPLNEDEIEKAFLLYFDQKIPQIKNSKTEVELWIQENQSKLYDAFKSGWIARSKGESTQWKYNSTTDLLEWKNHIRSFEKAVAKVFFTKAREVEGGE